MRHLLLSELWHPEIGGSVNLFDEIYPRRFARRDLVGIVAADVEGATKHDSASVVPVTRYDPRRYEWMRPESMAMYARMFSASFAAARQGDAEVIHCGRVIPEGLVGSSLRLTRGLSYTVWVHGEEVAMYLRYGVKKRLMPQILAGAKAVFCVSTPSRQLAISAGSPEHKTHVIYPSADFTKFDTSCDGSDIRQKHQLQDKLVLLSVGRLTRRKGHDYVLRALAKLRREDVLYLILSPGEMESELKALSRKLGLSEVVRFIGAVPTEEVPRYFAAADVFIQANRTLPDGDTEGFGLVLVEAAAAGLPVVAGRSGGTVDAIRHEETGLLVNGDSVDEIAGALTRLFDDRDLRNRFGLAGQRWVRSTFSWDASSRRVQELSNAP